MKIVPAKMLKVVKSSLTLMRTSSAIAPRRFEEIPGPKTARVIGTAPYYLPVIGKYNTDKLPEAYARMYREYGGLVREHVYGKLSLLHVFDVDHIYAVYMQDGNDPRRASHDVIGEYRDKKSEIYYGKGLLPSNGTEWRKFRDVFKPVLLDSEYIDSLGKDFEVVTEDMIKIIPSLLNEKGELDVSPLLFNWGLESIAYVTLDKRLGCLTPQGNPDAQILIKGAETTHKAIFVTQTSFWPFTVRQKKLLFKAQDQYTTILQGYMEEFLKDPNWGNKDCLLTRMIHAEPEEAQKKMAFTMLVDMFLAGIDSSSFTISWILYHLARNPYAQRKLREEVMGYLPNPDSSFADYDGPIPYLKACMMEALRMNPVSVGNGRVTNKSFSLGGYFIPEGVPCILQHQVASMNGQYFADPYRYNPDRWLEQKTFNIAVLPFGFGYRTCIGNMVAEKETLIGLAKIIRNFELTYHHAPVTTTFRLLNFPVGPIRIRFHKITS